MDHDRRTGLHSVPARLGVAGALKVARVCHLCVPVFLFAACEFASLGNVFLGALALVVLLLVYEHWLVRQGNLSRVGVAFFNVNVTISITVMLGVAGDVVLGGGR